MSLLDTLQELESLIAANAPAFYEKLNAGAGDEELESLRAELGAVPDDVATWFRWHAGSGDGFLPNTSWGLPTIEEAVEEIRSARSYRWPELAGLTLVPLLTGRDGGLVYYVAEADGRATMRRYGRDGHEKTLSFDAWLAWVVDQWKAERGILRVTWTRRQRSMTGVQELHLPRQVRAELRERLGRLPVQVEGRETSGRARFEDGAASGWRVDETTGTLVVTLTREAALELAATLSDKKNSILQLRPLDDFRIVLADR